MKQAIKTACHWQIWGRGGVGEQHGRKRLHLSSRYTPDPSPAPRDTPSWPVYVERGVEATPTRGSTLLQESLPLFCTRQARGRAATGPLQERWSTRMRLRTPLVACRSNRSVKPTEFRVFPAALNVRFVQARRINTELKK